MNFFLFANYTLKVWCIFVHETQNSFYFIFIHRNRQNKKKQYEISILIIQYARRSSLNILAHVKLCKTVSLVELLARASITYNTKSEKKQRNNKNNNKRYHSFHSLILLYTLSIVHHHHHHNHFVHHF